jgi:hypothetical protein
VVLTYGYDAAAAKVGAIFPVRVNNARERGREREYSTAKQQGLESFKNHGCILVPAGV